MNLYRPIQHPEMSVRFVIVDVYISLYLLSNVFSVAQVDGSVHEDLQLDLDLQLDALYVLSSCLFSCSSQWGCTFHYIFYLTYF